MTKVFKSFYDACYYVADKLEDYPDDYSLVEITLDLLSLDNDGNWCFTDDVLRFFEVDKLWKCFR